MAQPESTLSLKLFIDPKSKRVLFAEAGKDTVDFIIHILSLSVASVIKLIGKQEMVGCLGNLYESVENLNTTHIQQGQNKDIILKPTESNWTTRIPLLLVDKPNIQTGKVFYRCQDTCHGNNYVADDPAATCPSCSRHMNVKVNYVAYRLGEGGFVKSVATYMVTDDLVVKPVSPKFTIDLLNKLNVKELGELQEKEAYIGMKEASKLLKASLHSKNVLTTVFFNDISENNVLTTVLFNDM